MSGLVKRLQTLDGTDLAKRQYDFFISHISVNLLKWKELLPGDFLNIKSCLIFRVPAVSGKELNLLLKGL
jgi:hypothetical protein